MLKRYGKPLLATAAGLAVTVPAFAQVDTAAVVTEVQGIGTAITAIGTAVLLVAATVMAFSWIKAQFF